MTKDGLDPSFFKCTRIIQLLKLDFQNYFTSIIILLNTFKCVICTYIQKLIFKTLNISERFGKRELIIPIDF